MLPNSSWRMSGDLLDGDLAGELTRGCPAHAVADGENEILLIERRLAGFAQVRHVVAVEAQGEKGVFVILAEAPAIGEAGPI